MEIFNSIIALGGKNDPSKFPRQFRRHLQRDPMEENGRGAVLRMPIPQQSNISVSDLSEIDFLFLFCNFDHYQQFQQALDF